MQTAAARVLAVLLPVLVAAAWLGALARPEVRTHGAATAPDPAAQAALGEDPRVVLVGNSLAFRGVDHALVAAELGLPPERVVRLYWRGTLAPTWYAGLARDVFGAGHRPELVVIVGTLLQALAVEEAERSLPALLARTGPDLPALDHKVLGAARGPWGRVVARRGGIRDAIVGAASERAVQLLGGADQVDAHQALTAVFETEGATDDSLLGRVIPVVEEISAERPSAVVAYDASLLPDFAELARAHGAQLAVARIPVSERGRQAWPLPSPEVERQTVAELAADGVGYLPLHDFKLPKEAYFDQQHMTESGRRAYSAALGRALHEQGALSPEGMRPARLAWSTPTVRREGRPPDLGATPGPCDRLFDRPELRPLSDAALAELGVGAVSPVRAHRKRQGPRRRASKAACGHVELATELPLSSADGTEAWWVYPGTELVVAVAPSEEERTVDARASLIALPIGPGAGTPELQVAGTAVALQPHGLRLEASSPAHRPAGPWEVRLRVPEDGPYVLVRALAIERDGQSTWVVRTSDAELGWFSIVGPQVKPPPLSGAEPAPVRLGAASTLGPRLAAIELHGLDAITPAELHRLRPVFDPHPWRDRTPQLQRVCSPLTLWRGGRPLRQPVDDIASIETAHAWVHEAGRVVVRGSPEVEAALSPKRGCRWYRWLYPGDEIGLGPRSVASIHVPLGTLRLEAFAFGAPRDHVVRVEVASAAGTHGLHEVPLAQLVLGVDLPLEPPLPPLARDVVLHLASPDDAPFVLLLKAGVRVTPPP